MWLPHPARSGRRAASNGAADRFSRRELAACDCEEPVVRPADEGSACVASVSPRSTSTAGVSQLQRFLQQRPAAGSMPSRGGHFVRGLPLCDSGRLGSISARKFSKPSAVTNPAVTSSQSPSSTSLARRLVARTRSLKNDAPRPFSAARTSRAACERRDSESGSAVLMDPASNHSAFSRGNKLRSAPRASGAPGGRREGIHPAGRSNRRPGAAIAVPK